MKKFVISLTTICLMTITGCKEVEETSILERKIQRSMISRGDNVPDFSIRKDSADFLLFYLHKNKSLAEFKEDTKLDDETVNNTITLLKSKDWLIEKNGKLYPTVFLATVEDAKKLYQYSKKLSKQIADEIEKELPNIKAEFAKTDMAKEQSFEHWSFLILSNVLLDNWQIFELEKNFFKRPNGEEYDRPLRHGKYYYASIMENDGKTKESFGIYGNASMSFTNEREIAVYGNNRYTDYYMNLQSSDNLISNEDNRVLIKMAEDFLPKLLNILEKNRTYIEDVYKKTGYSKGISFEEFFLWWYHFIYTQATNDMNDRGMLNIPPDGNFDYQRSFE